MTSLLFVVTTALSTCHSLDCNPNLLFVAEFYEEALTLIYSLTSNRISADLWQCFEMMYTVFKKDGFEYFTEMMPALHNYITVDTPAFLSSEVRLQAVIDMCKTILTNDNGDDEECHAAKLLEVIVLQCQNSLGSQYLGTILQAVIERLLREVKTTELRTMLLQVGFSSATKSVVFV